MPYVFGTAIPTSLYIFNPQCACPTRVTVLTISSLPLVREYICYNLIRNLTRFEAGQPALKQVNPLRNRLTGFPTSSSPQAGFEAGQLRVKHFLTRFTTVASVSRSEQ